MNVKLDDIEKQGHETANIMGGANKELLNQRQVILGVADKNRNIQANLKAGDKMVRTISRNEFKSRAILYSTIVLLFVTDIILGAYLIVKWDLRLYIIK